MRHKIILGATLLALAALVGGPAIAQDAPPSAAILANNDVDRLIAVTIASSLSTHGIEATVHPSAPEGSRCVVALGRDADDLADTAHRDAMTRGLTGADRWETAEMADTAYRFITKQC